MKKLSLLIKQPKLWIFDIDGVIFVHNGHLSGKDAMVPGFFEFYNTIPKGDQIFLVSAREKKYEKMTKKALRDNGIGYHYIMFGVPTGERILVNDDKPDGSKTAFSLSTRRNIFPPIKVER